MSDMSEMELIADSHEVTEVNLITILGFCSMTSSIESLERLVRARAGYVLVCGSVPRSVANGAENWRLARSSGK